MVSLLSALRLLDSPFRRLKPVFLSDRNSNKVIPAQRDLAPILVAHAPDRNFKLKFLFDKLRCQNLAKVARSSFLGPRQSLSQHLCRRFVSQFLDIVGNALKGVVMRTYRLRQLSLGCSAPARFLGEFQEALLTIFFRIIRPSGLPAAVIPRPRWPPCNAAMALLRRSRSASNSAIIDCVFKGVRLLYSEWTRFYRKANGGVANPTYFSPDRGSKRLNDACLSRPCGVRSTNSISAGCSGLSHWTWDITSSVTACWCWDLFSGRFTNGTLTAKWLGSSCANVK
jgi:hypothetical protein